MSSYASLFYVYDSSLSLIFEEIITSYIDTGVGHSLEFLPQDILINLKNNLLEYSKNKKLKPAGIGRKQEFHQDELYRNDNILWIENESIEVSEMAFLKQMDEFILYLNASCYTGITNYEFHYTIYEKNSFYKKHIDQFSQNDSRVFSVIIYLNEKWMQPDGGELKIYHSDHTELIVPKMGSMVFFDSAKLPHEVLETQAQRLSITGWLRRD